MAELLAPAGTLEHLHFAFAYGADAVYAGMPRYGLRVRENQFNDIELLRQAIEHTHKKGKKIYITANIFAHNSKVKTFVADVEKVINAQPDALIMADPGLIQIVQNKFPAMPIHLSVQANTVNYETVKFWQKLRVQRIILSRELSLEEIAEIRQQCPDVELEVFVHGAMCIAYSGRCLLSGFINHRDANQGTCTNACRWEYQEVNHTSEIMIEEIGRPGQSMQMQEDANGTYIMNSKDLRAIEHVEQLLKIGIDSFKIEGRTKSKYYVSRVVQSYRQAIDDANAGKKFDSALLGSLENLANRGYTDGFFKRHHDQEYQNYLDGNSRSKKQLYVADIQSFDADKGMLEILSKNKISLGDKLEIILPDGNQEIIVRKIEDTKGCALAEVPGGGFIVNIPFNHTKVEYGLVAKYL